MDLKKLIREISNRTQTDFKDISQILNECKVILIDALNKGTEVKISNFGKFKAVQTKERFVLNPITKRYLCCEPKKKIVFKPYKSFKYCIK